MKFLSSLYYLRQPLINCLKCLQCCCCYISFLFKRKHSISVLEVDVFAPQMRWSIDLQSLLYHFIQQLIMILIFDISYWEDCINFTVRSLKSDYWEFANVSYHGARGNCSFLCSNFFILIKKADQMYYQRRNQ